MKHFLHIFLGCFISLLWPLCFFSQVTNSPAPYCNGSYSSGNCNQGGPSNTPGNSVNDFIDSFMTSGATTNINNPSSGCNGGPNNYVNYCSHYLLVSPGQVITCTLQSGITYGQGFAIFIDWNQDNVFNMPSEQVAATTAVPPAATPVVLTFTVPSLQAPGSYRLRVRCSFATVGANITPCGGFTYGETEDYTIYVGTIPANSGVVTATATGNSPLCAGQTFSMDVISSNTGVTYTWTGPGGFSSTLQSPVITNITATASGVYTVVTSGSCPTSKTVTLAVAPDAGFTLNPTAITICQGNHFTASVQFTNVVNPNAFTYNWACNAPPGIFQTGGPGPGIFAVASKSTIIAPSFIISPQEVLVYTVVVSPTLTSCPVVQTMTVTISNPVTPVITPPLPICNTGAPVALIATPGGGTWVATNTVQANAVQASGMLVPANALFSPNFGGATVNLLYSVNVGTCIVQATSSVAISQFVPPTLTSSLSTLCSSSLEAAVDLMSLVQYTLNGSWSGINVAGNYFSTSQPMLPTGTYSLTYSTQSSPNTSVCPGSTVLAVPVFNPPTPLISPIAPRCNNTGTVQLTASPTLNLLWTGNLGVSSTGILSPSSCAISGPAFVNSIFCTGGTGTCTATGSATFEIDAFRSAALTSSTPPFCVNSNPFDLMSIVQNTLGSWSGITITTTNNPGNQSPNTFYPGGLSGSYTLTYFNPSYPTAALCPSTQTLMVSVLNPPTPNISAAGPYCNLQGPLHLTVTPNTGTWTASSYLTPGGIFTPSLCPVGSNLVQYIIGTSTCNTQQTAFISVEGFVPSTITGLIPDQCITSSPLNLQPLTLNTLGSWHGPGILGSTFDPLLAGVGTIVITYSTASSPSGLCPDQSSVAVQVFSLATPVITSAGPFCTSAMPKQLLVSPVGGIFGGANTTAIDAEGLFVPSSAIIGNNVINYSVTVGPCVAQAQTTISVEKFIPADFISTAGPFCKNDPRLTRNFNEFVQTQGGQWAGEGIDPLTGVFTFMNANVGETTITHGTHSLPTTSLCPDTKTIQVTVYDTQDVTVSADQIQGCAPLKVTLSPNTNYGNGSWYFSDSSATEPGLGIHHTFTAPGTYSVAFNHSVVVASDFMCVAQVRLPGNIKVFASPKVDFNYAPNDILISEPQVHFTNTSPGIDRTRFEWTLVGPGGKVTMYDVDADYTFQKVGDYKVTLTATNLNSCKTELTKLVEVKSTFNVYIPTSFTPNNDGLNDTFYPVFSEYGLDEASYSLQIFDRWGAELFECKDRALAWDGKIAGHAAKPDVYVYRLKFRDLDGNVYNKSGYVTVIR